jgi:hypothetical protein
MVIGVFCTSCGTQLIADARYCPTCGATTRPSSGGEARRSSWTLAATFVGCLALDIVVSLVAVVWITIAAASRQSTYGTPGPTNTTSLPKERAMRRRCNRSTGLSRAKRLTTLLEGRGVER